ncbi:MAG: adenylate/guanylate cyclase domain-containing protein [Kofleriaceae bacterium]|nr:adenylate/guanylate cyclase domain-containing protein [Myxococcales bacterium]MCB9565388.1 adenylate/guanylate cyclase domain-containing protein [Kofleriaceae bacterium]
MARGDSVATRVQRRLGRWIRIGRTPDLLPSEARYVVLTNIVALLGVTFTLGFAPVLILSAAPLYPALQVAYALAYLPTLWLNHRGRPIAATTWLLLGSHVLVMSQVLVEGVGFDVHLFFMLHTVLPFLLFPPRHTRRMVAIAALAGVDLVVVAALADRLPQLGPAIAPERLAILRPILLGGLFATLAACAHYARRATLIAEAALDRAHQRSEELLLNILPPTIADRLKRSDGTIADGFADVTVLFADIVGFTTMSARLAPARVVELLNDLFCTFDDLAGRFGLEKIKTIGDCYMVAGGLPEPRPDHAEAVAAMGLAMLDVVRDFGARLGEPLDVRIGIHSGPVVAGVIGKRKFIYDMWGDTVNTASRMESHGLPGTIQVSAACRHLLDGKFTLVARGPVEIKGKGRMETWILEAAAPA